MKPYETTLHKRIKRHVVGRPRTYFVATSPGLEPICLRELSALALSEKDAVPVSGGIEFKGRLQDCYLANLSLRTANKILLRIDAFKASSFRQLERKLAGIPWELYLPANARPALRVATRHCRLYHTEAVADVFLNAISEGLSAAETLEASDPGLVSQQQIFVRGIDDRLTVSIDSSGELLYKRGLKTHTGAAPLRETLAAASLLLAGYTGVEPLVDPMCGSGTFSLEGALIAEQIPPGWFRKFAFMGWPSYRQKRFEHLRRQYRHHFTGSEHSQIFASDRDPHACGQLADCTDRLGFAGLVNIRNKDFFELDPQDLTEKKGIVAINPPYGRRIGTRRESETLFHEICARLKAKYKGWRVILIAPSAGLAENVPFRPKTILISHGGLKLTLMVGHIQ